MDKGGFDEIEMENVSKYDLVQNEYLENDMPEEVKVHVILIVILSPRSLNLWMERKELIHTFNDLGLKITILTNQQRSNFLDLTFDLTNGTYKPLQKTQRRTYLH